MPKFSIRYTISGSRTDIIDAPDLAAAKAIADANAEDEEFGFDMDEVDTVDSYVMPMHRVRRDGMECWVGYVLKSDERLPEPERQP